MDLWKFVDLQNVTTVFILYVITVHVPQTNVCVPYFCSWLIDSL